MSIVSCTYINRDEYYSVLQLGDGVGNLNADEDWRLLSWIETKPFAQTAEHNVGGFGVGKWGYLATYTGNDYFNDSDNGSGLQVPADGIYLASMNLSMSGGTRTRLESCFGIQPAGRNQTGISTGNYDAYYLDNTIAAMSYVRNSSSHNQSSNTLTTLLNLNKGDAVTIAVRRQSYDGAMTLHAEQSSMSLYRIGNRPQSPPSL